MSPAAHWAADTSLGHMCDGSLSAGAVAAIREQQQCKLTQYASCHHSSQTNVGVCGAVECLVLCVCALGSTSRAAHSQRGLPVVIAPAHIRTCSSSSMHPRARLYQQRRRLETFLEDAIHTAYHIHQSFTEHACWKGAAPTDSNDVLCREKPIPTSSSSWSQ